MADKSVTTKVPYPGSRQPSPTIEPTAEQIKGMEARIKRPIKEKKIDLESFDERGPRQQLTPEEIEKKRQQLISLTKHGAGPLRLQKVEMKGSIVLHLAPRTWSQYFYEKLWLFPKEKEVRRREVRAEIERYIRPWLERNAETLQSANGDGKTPSTVNNSKANAQTVSPGISNLELLDRLHCRVYTKRIDSKAFYGNQPKAPEILKVDDDCFTNHMRTAFHGITTVPNGLSIAQIAPFKVMADVRIMAPETRLLAEKYVAVEGNGTPCKELRNQIEGNNATPLPLEAYYRQLLDSYANDENKIVLEVQGIDVKHWKAAYSAAKKWMNKNKASVMLVPLYRPEDYEASRNDILDKKAWPSSIVAHLNSVNLNSVEPPTTKPLKKMASNHESTDSTATSQQLDKEKPLDF